MAKCFSVIKTAIEIDATFKKHGIELPEGEAVNITMLIKTLRLNESNASKAEMNFISGDIAYKVAVTNYDSYEVTALIVTRVEDNVRVFAEMINHQFNDDGQEYEPLVEEPVKENLCDKIKNVHGGLRARRLCEKLKQTDTPKEAYHLLLDFLGDDGEISGKIAKKNMVSSYHFSNSKVEKTVTIKLRTYLKDAPGAPILNFEINLSEDSVDALYESTKSMVELFK